MQKKSVKRKKKNRLRARFYSILVTLLIIISAGYFFWQVTNTQVPNLHGWESVDVLNFGHDHNVLINFEFVYSNDVAPTRVVSQSVLPGATITEDLQITVEISKGVEIK